MALEESCFFRSTVVAAECYCEVCEIWYCKVHFRRHLQIDRCDLQDIRPSSLALWLLEVEKGDGVNGEVGS